MARHKWIKLGSFGVVALALAISSLGMFAAAHSGTGQTAGKFATSYKTAVKSGPRLQIQNDHTVNAATVPQETKAQQATSESRSMPAIIPAKMKTLEQNTSRAQRAAASPHNAGESLLNSSSAKLLGPEFPSVFNKFPGMVDSATTCPPSGCQPPDMAVAAAPTGLALQVVNTSMDLYNNNGVQQSGWPKNSVTFFGIPNPTPSGCDPSGPFTSDPRAWFDAYDNRFGVAMLQLEGAGGVAPSCSFVTKYWIAISTSNNPSGTWRIFSVNMNFGSDATGFADFTQFGFNADGIYVSSNIFNNAGTAYDYAEAVGCGKQAIYSGGSIVCNSFFDFTVNGVAIDTVNPVQSLSTDFGPHAEYFVSAYNMNGDAAGDNCVTTACNGLSIWAWSDPANTTGSGNKLSGATVATTHSYTEPPLADQPSCTGGAGCVDTNDTRISATPTYHAGHIFAALVTGVTNGASQLVAGIQWFDIVPSLTVGYPATITGATLYQNGQLNASSGFVSTSFPVIMPDLDNDLMLGYDYMGDAIFPSINFTSRRVSDPLSTLPGGLGIVEVAGTASTTDSRWGDFEAMSYPATYQDFIWFAAQYAASSPDWSTELIKLRFNLNG